MSTDLSRTLHLTIDGEPVGVPSAFDMTRVRSRARRRRVARTATRGAVGVGAAGAVAVGAVQANGRDASVLPPAVAGAPAGTCGSDTDALGDLPTDADLSLGALTADQSWAIWTAADGTAGGAPDGGPVSADADGAGRRVLTSVLGPTVWLWPQYGAVVDPTAFPPEPAPGVETPASVRVVVAHDGTVVGESLVATSVADALTSISGWDPLEVSLTTCDQPGRDGGDPLPPGDYEVYVAPDDGPLTAPVATVAGPWVVRVIEPHVVAGLPAGFPTDVPLVPGRLLETRTLDDGGWFVELATSADDGVAQAAVLLGEPLRPGGVPKSVPLLRTSVSDWEVELVASERDGMPTVTYSLHPR